MTQYCIVEDENGWRILEHPENEMAEEAAHRAGVQLVDSGPYHSWEDANEAMEALLLESEETDESDTPGTQPLEGRSETGD
ncbi:MAG: hypothetical protein HUJ26_06455 [Planctomycetaceae bacterium]|nr:hypothetical protein [Planctomycetaceae bacterium]